MSAATLSHYNDCNSTVIDFKNYGLFLPPPRVVRVQGWNFPGTIHHSKAAKGSKFGYLSWLGLNTSPFTCCTNVSICYYKTDMLAFEKNCEVHLNLTNGCAFDFLTQRQEISGRWSSLDPLGQPELVSEKELPTILKLLSWSRCGILRNWWQRSTETCFR
jgi:hypothetical protein